MDQHSPDDGASEPTAIPPSDRPKPIPTPFESSAARIPEQIGPYRILELLGEGGMGSVYKAEQRAGVRRTVAVKVIKSSGSGADVLARFDAERQALARMDHPNIARVLHAGQTAEGQPYLVMEYVPGIPITTFADQNKLPISQRLELFMLVCSAISHAHTKAIIHRDIKASNVLAYMADGKATVKVIDFGIAKALAGDRLTDRTFNTQMGRPIGTYASMSPEQADASPDIDTRTDVYSLGVLLYELLTGMHPFDQKMLARLADQEMRRVIREENPPRPSTRLSSLGAEGETIATARRVAREALARQLRAELEWIPLMAMRKERDRRYAGALEMSEDIRNYLEGRPLRAGPESQAYRLKKFARRHRVPLIAALAVVLGVAGAVQWYIHAIRTEQRKTEAALAVAQAERDEAVRQQRIALAVQNFLSDMLAKADPRQSLGENVTVAQAIQAAAKHLDNGALKDAPLVEASIRTTIGLSFWGLGRLDDAELNLRRAMEINRMVLPAGDPGIATSLFNLACVLRNEYKIDEAEKLHREALAIRRKALPPDDPAIASSLEYLGNVMQARDKLAKAEQLHRESLAIRRRALPAGDLAIAESLRKLAQVLAIENKAAEAEPLSRESMEMVRKLFPPGHPEIAESEIVLGIVLEGEQEYDQAEALFREALEIRRKVFPAGHIKIRQAMLDLVSVLRHEGKYAEAASLARAALDEAPKEFPSDSK